MPVRVASYTSSINSKREVDSPENNMRAVSSRISLWTNTRYSRSLQRSCNIVIFLSFRVICSHDTGQTAHADRRDLTIRRPVRGGGDLNNVCTEWHLHVNLSLK